MHTATTKRLFAFDRFISILTVNSRLAYTRIPNTHTQSVYRLFHTISNGMYVFKLKPNKYLAKRHPLNVQHFQQTECRTGDRKLRARDFHRNSP